MTGCYAQRAPEEAASLPGVRWVVGNTHKELDPRDREGGTASGSSSGTSSPQQRVLGRRRCSRPPRTARGPTSRSRTAATTAARSASSPSCAGRSRSAPPDQVLDQVRDLAARYREVVLSGVNLGRWGREPGMRMRLVGFAAAAAGGDGDRAPAAQLGGADGPLGRSAGTDGLVAAHRAARACAAADRARMRCCGGCGGGTGPGITRTASGRRVRGCRRRPSGPT